MSNMMRRWLLREILNLEQADAQACRVGGVINKQGPHCGGARPLAEQGSRQLWKEHSTAPVWRQQIMATAMLTWCLSFGINGHPFLSPFYCLVSMERNVTPPGQLPPPRLIVLHLRSFLRLQPTPELYCC